MVRRKQPAPPVSPSASPAAAMDGNGEWQGWSPEFSGTTAHAQQERHSPTRAVTLRGAPARCNRRLTDARLWDSLPLPLQDAAREIAAAYHVLSHGLGYAASDPARLPGARGTATSNPLEWHGRAIRHYTRWAKACKQARIHHSLVVDVLVFGFSCRAIDRDRRAKRGFARLNLALGLALYCEIRGWPPA